MNILPTRACLKEGGIDFLFPTVLFMAQGGNMSALAPLLSYG